MTSEANTTHRPEGYAALLKNGGFQSFLWTQFLGAFNDNVYKMIVSVLAVELAADQAAGSRYLALAGTVFVLPFLLFAGYAGQLADRYSKTRVLQITKAGEMLIMLLGIGALLSHSMEALLGVLFLLALQANFFSPAKYGVLPEMVGARHLSRANGLLELTTFAAIVLGTSFGTFLFEHWKGQPLTMGLVLLGIAVAGSAISLKMPRIPAVAAVREPLHRNPFHEIWQGAKRLREQPALGASVIGMSFFWFLGGLFQMSMLLVGRETLHISEMQVGLLLTALAVGISLGSLAAGRLSGDHVELGLVPAGAAVMGVCSIAVGLTLSYAGALVWLSLVGFGGGLFIVPLNAYLQERAGAAEKGRLLATNNFANMVGVVLASGALWLLHDQLHWTASHIVVALGVLTLLAGAIAVAAQPASSLRLVLLGVTHLLFRIRITGQENLPRQGGAVLVANHVSFADALLIGSLTPRLIRFLMWQPIFETRLLKPVCRILRAIPLATDSPKAVIQSLREARATVQDGELACIFPEGGLTRTGEVMPFQRGVERIVANTEAPIVPIYLDGLWGHPLSRKPGARWNWRRCEVNIHIGRPLPASTAAGELQQQVLELSSERPASETLPVRFVQAARRHWSEKAVADSTGKQLTYRDTLIGALLLRRWLMRNTRNQRFIGLLLPASVGGALANLAVALAGRTSVNLNFTAGEESLRGAIQRCGIRTILTSRAFVEKAKLPSVEGMVYLEDLLPSFSRAAKLWAFMQARLAPVRMITGSARPEDLATVIFSSGSTGEPKGVMLTHANLLANVGMVAKVYDVKNSRECLLGALPFFHSFGYTFTLWFPLLNGFPAVYHANPMDAKTIGELAERHRATFLLATPTFLQGYLRKCTPTQFAALRHVLVGAEKLRESLATAFQKKFGIRPLEGYGCTEMSPVVAVNTPQAWREGSVGRPLPGITVRIVDPETREPLPAGREGLLLVKGANRMAGYLGDGTRTAQVLHEEYYMTGDLARVDEEGFLYILDRLARFSKIAGEMVPHLKVEDSLAAVLGPGACVVVGIPDEQRGERLAVLYVHDQFTTAQLVEQLNNAGLPALWIPKRDNFYRVESLPLLGTGKMDLRRARTLAQEMAARVETAAA